jgi:hypothetical protein
MTQRDKSSGQLLGQEVHSRKEDLDEREHVHGGLGEERVAGRDLDHDQNDDLHSCRGPREVDRLERPEDLLEAAAEPNWRSLDER